MKFISADAWESHELLWKVRQFTNDQDGFSYLAVEHPLHFDYEIAERLEIQFREPDGEWLTAQYHGDMFLAGHQSFAWDFGIHYLETDGAELEWRAVEHDAPIN